MQEFAFHVYISSLWLLTWLKHDNLITTTFARRGLQITERISKRRRVFPVRGQSKYPKRKSFKKLQVQTRVENDFSFNFYAKQRRLKR